MSRRAAWLVEERSGTASALHAPWPAPGHQDHRLLSRCEASAPALVLGSAQPHTIVAAGGDSASDLEVTRRGSGGGAVLLLPGRQLWLDAWVPRNDPLWDDDVVRSSWWFGDVWAAALESLGVTDVHVHHGRAIPGEWSDRVCFAGTGPGEVQVAGRKVVGLSQRRTRAGARLSALALSVWDADALLELLELTPDERGRAAPVVAEAAVGLESVVPSVPPSELLDLLGTRLVSRMP